MCAVHRLLLYMQHFQFFFLLKCNCFEIWFPDVWCFISVQHPPPTVQKKKNPACLLLKSFCCVLFPSWCLRCSSAGGNRHVIAGSKVNVSFSCVGCGQVFIILSWLLCHCDDCMYYKMLPSRGGQICFLLWRFPGRLIMKSLKQEWHFQSYDFQILKPLLSNNMWRCV